MRLTDPYLMLTIAAGLGVVAIILLLVDGVLILWGRHREAAQDDDDLVQSANPDRTDIYETSYPWGDDED